MDPRVRELKWFPLKKICFSLFFDSYAFSFIINVKMNNVKYTI